jgi:transposase-like protein
MHRSGINFHEIERLTGINHNTVINWVKQQEMSSLLSMDDDALLSS